MQGKIPETNIIVSHRTNSKCYCHVTDHAVSQSDKMSSRKHPADWSLVCPCATTSSTNDTAPKVKKGKGQVAISTFDKWQWKFNWEHQTLTWLRCDRDKRNRSLVALLWYSAYREYRGKICSTKNYMYSRSCTNGLENQGTSSICITGQLIQCM